MNLRRLSFGSTHQAAASTWENRVAKLRVKYLSEVMAQAKKLVSKDPEHKDIKVSTNEITFYVGGDKIYLKLDWSGNAKMSGIVKLGRTDTKVFYDVDRMTPRQIAVEWTSEIFLGPI